MLAMEVATAAAATSKAVAKVKWRKEQTKPLARLLDPSLSNNSKLLLLPELSSFRRAAHNF